MYTVLITWEQVIMKKKEIMLVWYDFSKYPQIDQSVHCCRIFPPLFFPGATCSLSWEWEHSLFFLSTFWHFFSSPGSLKDYKKVDLKQQLQTLSALVDIIFQVLEPWTPLNWALRMSLTYSGPASPSWNNSLHFSKADHRSSCGTILRQNRNSFMFSASLINSS